MEKEKLDQVMSPDVLKEGKEQILLEKGSLLMLDHVPRCVNDDFFSVERRCRRNSGSCIT